MTVGQWPRLFFVYVVLFFDVCYFFDVSFHKRRAEFVAMPHIATYRISGRPLIPIVFSVEFVGALVLEQDSFLMAVTDSARYFLV